MASGQLAALLKKHVLRRSLPHGVCSWRYLRPHPPEKIRLHRTLWLRARPSRMPLPLFLSLEFILWLRWITFSCWRCCLQAVACRGKAVAEQEGLGRATQLGRLLLLGLGHCIPPGEAYAFGLYRRGARRTFWDYVFIHEVQAFHRWRGARTCETAESLALLQDKFRVGEFLGNRGVPMIPNLDLIPRGTAFDPLPYLRSRSRIFCKPNRGSAGRDAFVIERQEKEIAIFATNNGVKAGRSSHKYLQQAMARDDFLIQPLVENHPDFAGLCPAGDVITLRVISESHPERGMVCYCAMVEIPNPSNGSFNGHSILPIEPSSGRIMASPRRLPPEAQTRHDAVFGQIGNRTVPFWDRILKSAFRSHQCVPDLYAVAWDYVATPTGPVMLEGNTSWGTTVPQTIHGGLLRDEIVTG